VPSIRAGVLAIAAGMTLVSCANAVAVRWATYDPALRARIDAAIATKACPSLQKLLDSAKQTSGEHERATGYPNDNLVAFIEEAQAKAGCP
jgi:hypothetical protein